MRKQLIVTFIVLMGVLLLSNHAALGAVNCYTNCEDGCYQSKYRETDCQDLPASSCTACFSGGYCTATCDLSCGAPCVIDNDCPDYCIDGETLGTSGTCEYDCTCSYTSQNCNLANYYYCYGGKKYYRDYECAYGNCNSYSDSVSEDCNTYTHYYCKGSDVQKYNYDCGNTVCGTTTCYGTRVPGDWTNCPSLNGCSGACPGCTYQEYGCTGGKTCSGDTCCEKSTSDSYCAVSGTYDTDSSSSYCTACSLTWMTNAPTSGTRCCGDDSPDNSYYYSANPTTATSLTCERCNAGSYVTPIAYYGNGYYAGSLTTSTTTKCYYGDIICSAASGANGTNANIYGNGWANASVTAAPVILCYYGDMGCGDGTYSNGTSGTYYGNGYMPGSSTSRVCYYGDISCSDGSATNGTTQTVYGWGWYNASLTTSISVSCLSGAATCSDGSASNDTISTLYGNGYMPGSGTSRTCYYGDIACSSGSEADGTTATVYGWGWYNESLTTAPIVVCRKNAGSCLDGSYANGSAGTLCGNGYFSSSAVSCTAADRTTAASGYCYYGDITCADGADGNGTVSGILRGNGYTAGNPATDASGVCYYDDIACSNGASGNGSSATVYGNGYYSGATCYHGDWSCGDGTYANGSSCALACGGVGSDCCTSQNIYTDTVGCSGSGCAQTDHERDSGQSYCTASASGCTAYYWGIGGEINASVCCGDDASENRLVRFCGSWCASNASDDACCDAAGKCVYNDACYGTGSCYADDAYCDAGTWHDSDDGQSYCESCSGAGRWSAGGEISPTTCCSDDTGENYAYRIADGSMDNDWATNSSDNACCNAANKCVAESVCYASGSRSDADSDGDDDYCNAGTWYDCNAASDCPAGYDCYGGDCVDVIDLSYVLPTPVHDSRNTANSVTINATANDTQSNNIDTCTLEWNGANETMTKVGSGTYVICRTTKATVDGTDYTFRVYANDSAGVIELENQRSFTENSKPSLSSVSINTSFAKNGDYVTVTTSGTGDPDADSYYMRCGNASGVENVCNSTLGTGERNCTFASEWTDSAQHMVYCRLYDGYEYSQERNATLTSDNTPPTPEPAQMSSLVLGSTSATVTSVVASDGGSGLHATAYRFHDSSAWSSWQASNVYVNSSLEPDTQYCFRVQYRDNVSNVGTQSSEACSYTPADQPSMTGVACYYDGTHHCEANFSMGSNPTGIDYYIDETTGSAGGSDKNWTTWSGEVSYTDDVSLPHAQYCYRIKARNQNNTETAYSPAVCNTTYNHQPSVSAPKTYDSSMTQKSAFRAGRAIYIRINVTDGDGAGDIGSVRIRIRDNSSDIRVSNADMTQLSAITDGYVYQYQYTIPSNADGAWSIEITASDLGGAESDGSSSFSVISLKLNVRLVLNDTLTKTYVPGSGEKTFGDLAYAYYPAPEQYYIASYANDSLYGLVFQNNEPLGVLVDKGASNFTIGLDLKYPNSITFLVASKGDWKAINNRIAVVNSSRFLQYSEPTFSFGLGDKYPMSVVLRYDDMDILGRRMDVGRGSSQIAIRHEGLSGQEIGLNISRK